MLFSTKLYPTLAVVIFLLVQVLVGALLSIFHSGGFVSALWISGATTLAALSCLRLFKWRQAFSIRAIDWSAGFVGIVAAIFGAAAFDIAEEMLSLPDNMNETFISIQSSFAGVLYISTIGPVVEEVVFRECLLGHLLRRGTNRWVAIIASSLVFGIIHFNPVQMFFATAIGIILSIIYYKSGNIVLTSVIHILNNSAAMVQMRVLGDDAADFRLTEWLGGITVSAACALAAMAVCAIMLCQFWNTYKKIQKT